MAKFFNKEYINIGTSSNPVYRSEAESCVDSIIANKVSRFSRLYVHEISGTQNIYSLPKPLCVEDEVDQSTCDLCCYLKNARDLQIEALAGPKEGAYLAPVSEAIALENYEASPWASATIDGYLGGYGYYEYFEEIAKSQDINTSGHTRDVSKHFYDLMSDTSRSEAENLYRWFATSSIGELNRYYKSDLLISTYDAFCPVFDCQTAICNDLREINELGASPEAVDRLVEQGYDQYYTGCGRPYVKSILLDYMERAIYHMDREIDRGEKLITSSAVVIETLLEPGTLDSPLSAWMRASDEDIQYVRNLMVGYGWNVTNNRPSISNAFKLQVVTEMNRWRNSPTLRDIYSKLKEKYRTEYYNFLITELNSSNLNPMLNIGEDMSLDELSQEMYKLIIGQWNRIDTSPALEAFLDKYC